MSSFRVLIAGAGIAAVETLLALRHLAGERVAVDLMAPTPDFVYRPLSVLEPFGGGKTPRVPVGTIARQHDAGHLFDGLAAVDPGTHTVRATSGETFGYEALVVAIGARPVEALPGSITFPGAGAREFRRLLAALVEGRARSVAFVVPREATWSLPLYELALLTASFLERRAGARPDLAVITAEPAPLAAFGDRASRAVGELLKEHAVVVHAGLAAERVVPGGVRLEDGGSMRVERVVAPPVLAGPEIAGLPNEAGFIPVDEHGRVEGVEDVYAAGDVTTRTPKQGGLAAQQGEVVAEALAERAGAPVRPAAYRPVLRGVVFAGAEKAYLRSDTSEHRRRSMAALRPLWWPPAKVAGRYLAPYLAARGISIGV